MTGARLSPGLPFLNDEVAQGYFGRLGYFHAGVNIEKFCRYTQLMPNEIVDGTQSFIGLTADLSGVPVEKIRLNTLQRISEDGFELRGERLALPVLRRTTLCFCTSCLRDDKERKPDMEDGAYRLRWSWLLRPVVTCPVHGERLTKLRVNNPVRNFDLGRLLAANEVDLVNAGAEPIPCGALQAYVLSRMSGNAGEGAWLENQGITSAIKVCEMLGALIEGGPNARVGQYTEQDWARVGDIGFDVCVLGVDAIMDVFAQLRISGGRRSGRAGAQAAYGFLFRWMKKTQRAEEYAPLKHVLREAILENFAIEPGEDLMGEEVTQRRVHSVNSLADATGLQRWALTRMLRKVGLIPPTDEVAAFNQWVFPAQEGEQLAERILNSVPLYRLPDILGCTKSMAGLVVRGGFITSVVPIEEGTIGLTQGRFNRDELDAFVAQFTAGASVCEVEEGGYVDLTTAAKGRSSVAEVIGLYLDGKLAGTRLLNGVPRLDHLRFDLAQVRRLTGAGTGEELHRLTSVSLTLGIPLDAVKKLVSSQGEGPRLAPAPANLCVGRRGACYVSHDEIERFRSLYVPIAQVAKRTGRSRATDRKLLAQRGIRPVLDPSWLGAALYLWEDVSCFVSEANVALSEQTEEEHAMLSSENGILVNAMMSDCESDASRTYSEGASRQ